jgi:hypothetical protein
VVFASEKDRTIPGAPLHTNFRLSDDGEYLALVDPSGHVVSDFFPAYPAQRRDVSYGRARLDTAAQPLVPAGILRPESPHAFFQIEAESAGETAVKATRVTKGEGVAPRQIQPGLQGREATHLGLHDAILQAAAMAIPAVGQAPGQVTALRGIRRHQHGEPVVGRSTTSLLSQPTSDTIPTGMSSVSPKLRTRRVR